MLQDFIPPSSFVRHTCFMDLSVGDRVFYTRSNSVRVATNALFMAFAIVHDVCYVKGW